MEFDPFRSSENGKSLGKLLGITIRWVIFAASKGGKLWGPCIRTRTNPMAVGFVVGVYCFVENDVDIPTFYLCAIKRKGYGQPLVRCAENE